MTTKTKKKQVKETLIWEKIWLKVFLLSFFGLIISIGYGLVKVAIYFWNLSPMFTIFLFSLVLFLISMTGYSAVGE